jgi:hypothetical protein
MRRSHASRRLDFVRNQPIKAVRKHMQEVSPSSGSPLRPTSAMDARDGRTVYAAIGVIAATIVLIAVFHDRSRLVTVIFDGGC